MVLGPLITVGLGGRIAGSTMLSRMVWPAGALRSCTWDMEAVSLFLEKKAGLREVGAVVVVV